jgi:hypothetical protein
MILSGQNNYADFRETDAALGAVCGLEDAFVRAGFRQRMHEILLLITLLLFKFLEIDVSGMDSTNSLLVPRSPYMS